MSSCIVSQAIPFKRKMLIYDRIQKSLCIHSITWINLSGQLHSSKHLTSEHQGNGKWTDWSREGITLKPTWRKPLLETQNCGAECLRKWTDWKPMVTQSNPSASPFTKGVLGWLFKGKHSEIKEKRPSWCKPRWTWLSGQQKGSMLGEVRLEVLGGGDPWPANESVESGTGRALSHCMFWTRRLSAYWSRQQYEWLKGEKPN